MNDTSSTSATLDPADTIPGHPDLRARIALRLLNSLSVGELEVITPDGSAQLYRGTDTAASPAQAGHRAQLVIHDFKALSMAVSRGDIGFGEAYMQGLWSTPQLSSLLRLLSANRDAMRRVIYGRWWATLIDQLLHMLRSNRKAQARKNIAAHYDLGNDFYAIWLDPTMTYSSALFDATGCWGRDVDLQKGQEQKMDRAIAQLGLDPANESQQVLEIGCGWGGLAQRLLQQTRASYKGLTLSVEQQAWTRERLGTFGAERTEVALQDYREEQGRFDGIVSIEMFEAVGEKYWGAYFSALSKCLSPKGRAVIQTIVIRESLFEKYRRGTDFIQRYIFPGGMLPSASGFEDQARNHGLRVLDRFAFGQDYSRTLAEWLKRFDAQRPAIEALGFDARFQRMWRFYLAYCEAGFAEGDIDVIQFTLSHQN